MSYFDNNGCQLHYEEFGCGQPLVLIHGLGSSALDWEYQIPELSRHYHVFAIDLRGHGRSDKPNEAYSMEVFAADVVAFIESQKLPKVHLVGISMGAMVGFQLATEHVELLRSLTIVNSSPEVKAKKAADYVQIAKRWMFARILSLKALGIALGKMLFPKPEQAELRKKIEERWQRNNKRAYLASLNAIIGWGVREHLSRITCPTLVISADKDYTPVALKQEYVDELPNARLEVIIDSRHATPMDQPLEFNNRLLAFLMEVDTITATPA